MSNDPFTHGFDKWEKRFQQMLDDDWALGDQPTQEVQLGATFYRHFYGDESATAFDLGAGDGRNTLWLAQQGFSVTAIDAAPSGVGRIQKRLDTHKLSATLTVADLRTYQLPPDIDLLVSSYLIHMMPDPYQVIERWQAHTRPGGICVLATRGSFPDDPDHYWFPQDFELKHLFIQASWEILHAREEDEWQPNLNRLFRRRAVVARKPA